MYTPGTCHVILNTWHLTLGTCHVILNTWHLTPVLDMSYLTPDPNTQYMTYFHVVQVHWLDIVTLDRTLPPLIPYYMTYSWLSLLRGLGMTIILLPDVWYSWTPVLLNPCILEPLYTWTLEIGRLLILLLILSPANPRNRITMDNVHLWIPCGHYYLRLYYI